MGETMVGELVRTAAGDDPAAGRADHDTSSWVRTADGETVRIDSAAVEEVASGSEVEVVVGGPGVSSETGGGDLVPPRAVLDLTVREANAPAPCSAHYDMWDQAAAAVGFVPGPGRHLLLHVSSYGLGTSWPCEYTMAEIGAGPGAGGMSYVRGSGTADLARQLGHNFGLGHSLALRGCQGSIEHGCETGSEGDWYDVMAPLSPFSPGSLSTPQAAALGVLPTDAVQTIGSAGTGDRTYSLSPMQSTSGVRALKLVTGSAVYWLEYRPAAGPDAWLASPTQVNWPEAGVLVRRVPLGSDDVHLLDPTPTWDPADRAVAMPLNVPVTMSSVFQVTVVSASASEVTLRVSSYYLGRTPGDPDCARRSAVSMSGVALLPTDEGLSAAVVGLDRGLWLRPLDGGPASWQSLGGGVLHGPAAVRAGDTSYVFVLGLDGTLFYRTDAGSGWSGWRNLGGYLTASPAAASLGEGHVRVFGRGLDGQLWSRELSGALWSSWMPHGGYLTSPPGATAVLDADRIEVTVRGTDGSSFTQALPRGSASAPYIRRDIVACSALIQPSVRTAEDPAIGAFVAANGRPDLLVSASTWAFGGGTTSTPAFEYIDGGGAVMVVRGLDNALWVHDGSAGGTGWTSLGGYVV